MLHPNSVRRIACLCVPGRICKQAAWAIPSALASHSPVVEQGPVSLAERLFYLDARLCQDEVAWSRAVLAEAKAVAQAPTRLGLAGSRFAAWVAAQTAPEPGYQVVAEADRQFLSPLPVKWLPLSPEVQRRLRLLGLCTIGQFAALREVQVVEQFGPESRLAHRWARGLDEPALAGQRQEIVEASHDFEVAEEREEVLLEAAVKLAARARQDLPAPQDAWAIQWVELETVRAGKAIRQSAWLGQAPEHQALRTLFGNLLGTLQGAGPGVAEMRVRLLGFEPVAGRQLSLFGHSESRLRWEQALEELARKHPSACVVRVEPLDAEAPLIAERFALREYQP